MKKFWGIVALILLAAGAPPAYSALWQWSLTASSNGAADPTINWQEGMSPSSINDSARAMMARTAEWRNDISGERTSGGTSTAYTLGTNQALGGNGIPSPPPHGTMLSFVAHAGNGVNATIVVDGGTAYPLQVTGGTALPSGTLVAGTPYRMSFNSSVPAWVMEGGYGNPYSVPLGAFLHSTLPTPPNSNFVLPAGQCLSTTTYAAYWVALGSPASGSCPGGQFAVVDTRSRNLVPLDNLNGTPAGRLTAGGNGCGTAMTVMGASCGNGTESKTITLGNLPTGITSTGAALTVSTTTTANLLSNGNAAQNLQSGTNGFGWSNNPTVGTVAATGSTTTGQAVVSNNTSGTPIPTVDPNIAVYLFLRVL